jgi:hypothetical protein
MALKGTLKDFGLSDIFQLIAHQGKTGVLHLEDRGKIVNVTFEGGKVVYADSGSAKTQEKELLGEILKKSGLMSNLELEETLEEQKRTMKKLGVIIQEKNYLTPDTFRKVLEFQVRETLFKIFQWTSGNYRFEGSRVTYDKEFVKPLSAEFVLMEAARIIDEWPGVKVKIPSMEMVFARVPGGEERLVRRSEPAKIENEIDDAFDFPGMGEGEKPKSYDGDRILLTAHQERIYDLLDGVLSVSDLAYRSLLGDFETASTVADLLGMGLIKPVKVPASVPKSAEKVKEPLGGRRLLGVAGTAVVVAVVLVAAFYMFSISGPRLLIFGQITSEKAVAVRQSLAEVQKKRLELALEVYRLERGGYPAVIEELVQSEYVLPSDIKYPFSSPYRIEGTEKGPVLVNPEE